jgi:hypothetical protein
VSKEKARVPLRVLLFTTAFLNFGVETIGTITVLLVAGAIGSFTRGAVTPAFEVPVSVVASPFADTPPDGTASSLSNAATLAFPGTAVTAFVTSTAFPATFWAFSANCSVGTAFSVTDADGLTIATLAASRTPVQQRTPHVTHTLDFQSILLLP